MAFKVTRVIHKGVHNVCNYPCIACDVCCTYNKMHAKIITNSCNYVLFVKAVQVTWLDFNFYFHLRSKNGCTFLPFCLKCCIQRRKASSTFVLHCICVAVTSSMLNFHQEHQCGTALKQYYDYEICSSAPSMYIFLLFFLPLTSIDGTLRMNIQQYLVNMKAIGLSYNRICNYFSLTGIPVNLIL